MALSAFRKHVIFFSILSKNFSQLIIILPFQWDQDFSNKPLPQILSGGYEDFQLRYPVECTNPSYKPKAPQFEEQSFGKFDVKFFTCEKLIDFILPR